MGINALRLKILILFFNTLLLFSCRKYEYSKCVNFQTACWTKKQHCVFDNIQIPQDKIYSIKIILHYNDKFPFQNIYLKTDIEDNNKQLIFSETQNHFLFDPITGYPINDNNILLNHKTSFIISRQLLIKGFYKVTISQFNRLESLSGIQQIQLVIE